jgi:hypothetical protein
VEALGPVRDGARMLHQTLRQRTAATALSRSTLWPAGLWSGKTAAVTQPADAGERSGEVTRTTCIVGVI